MRTIDVLVGNEHGLHARPAANFVRAAAAYKAKITIENLELAKAPVDAKSIFMVLAAGVSKGHTVRLTATGEDEDAAIEALEAAILAGLGETL